MNEPIDILEVAANRLADARVAVITCVTDKSCSSVDVDIAHLQLRAAQQDMAAVSRVMEELR